MKKDVNDFEEQLRQLNTIVLTLENGDIKLNDALNAFEMGIKLYKSCHETIENAEAKVKVLIDDLDLGEKKQVDLEDYGD